MFKVACATICCVASALVLLPSDCRADSPDAVFLAGLRERRLFELAERYCVDRLADPQVVEPLRTELMVERIRTLATQAVHAPADRREAIWRQARQVTADAARASPPSPRLFLVRLQDALTPLAQGELGRQEFEAGALADERLEPTRQALREAGDLLAALDKELTAEIPLRRSNEPRSGELRADELVSLQQQARQQLARAARNRALLYAAGSDDRLALLLRASETLQATLAQLAGDEPLARTLQLDLAGVQRLLGRHDEAGQLLAGLNVEGVDPEVRLGALAEQIRLAIAQDNAAAAERLIEQGRTIDGHSSPELDFAWLEAFLALARRADEAKDAAAAKRFQDRAAESARFLESSHGTYWGRRADQLLIAMLPRTAGTVNAELLARTADRLYLAREFDRATAAYDDAAAQARAAGDLNVSFELSYKAALVEQSRQRHEAAARRFRTLSKSLATHPQAPAAHLAGAWHAAQLVKDDPAAADAYAAILREHLAAWPSDETTAQARLWLGRLLASQEQWSEAAKIYSLVPRSSEHFPAAALAAAALILTHQPEQARAAEQMLEQALSQSPDAPAQWKAAAQAQLVIALAGQADRHDEALTMLRKIGADSPEQLLAVLHGLSRSAERGRSEDRQRIAKLQMLAAALLAPARSQLTPEDQQTLDRAKAEALAAAGRRGEALEAYQSLAAAHPNSGPIQQGYAELLLAGDDKASLQAALAQWRIIASRTRPRTDRWYQAKYSIAQAQFKLGDKAEAVRLLRYTLETPPGIADAGWKQRFTDFLKESGQVGNLPH